MSVDSPQVGYARSSSLMASDADLNIFRSFKTLNARNILYLQSELAELEETLYDLDQIYNDRTKGNDSWSVPRSWRAVKKEGGEYLECVHRLRKTSKEYYKALQAQSWLLNQKGPAARPRKNLRGFFEAHQSDMSQMDASFILEERYQDDLVAVLCEEKEVLSEYLEKYLYKAFENKRIASHGGEMLIFSNQRIRSVVRLLAILISSVLPILSIMVLYVIKNEQIRLGMIVVFSALCSTALATLSSAKNSEIMAVTAAYAAVQVVFIGGNPIPG